MQYIPFDKPEMTHGLGIRSFCCSEGRLDLQIRQEADWAIVLPALASVVFEKEVPV